MKLFIFRPSNVFVDKIDIPDADSAVREFRDFVANSPDLPNYSYAEMGRKTWTLISRFPLNIQEGRIIKEDNEKDVSQAPRFPASTIATPSSSKDEMLLEAMRTLITEVRSVKEQCAKTKWAVRAVGFIVVIVVLFGSKVIVQ